MSDKPRRVLDGHKVLDFTQFLAGPTVTRIKAEMGADIIKVEIAPIGDSSRGLPFQHDGRSAYYIQQNRGNRAHQVLQWGRDAFKVAELTHFRAEGTFLPK